MSFLRTLRDAPLRFVIAAIFVFGSAGSAASQEPAKPQASPPRTIILPQKLLAGNPATLSVLDAAGRVKAGTKVELSTGEKVTTDAAGRALFVAPSEPGAMTARISGQRTSASSTVVASPEPAAPNPVEATQNQGNDSLSFPRFLTLHDQFTIEGNSFSGRADSNHVYLGDQPCLVVASSPLSLVVLPGLHIPTGPVPLRIRANARDVGPFPVSMVLLEFSGPAEAVTAGSQTRLILHARGTTEPLDVEVRNASPGIIQFPQGNVQRLRTSGGEQNIVPVDTKLLAAGNYIVTARLIPTMPGQANLAAVRQKLLEARAAAFGTWTARVNHVIARIDESPLDVAQIRADLKQILDDKPTGQFASLLDSAWQELNPR
jgi:hypothetical protein